jgi:dUTPase
MAEKGIDIFDESFDAGFRGELKILVINNGSKALQVKPGERLAHLSFEVAPDIVLDTSTLINDAPR